MKVRSNLPSESIHVRQQVAAVLLQSPRGGGTGSSSISQSEIAAMLSTTRETVSKSLTSLAKEGALRIERNRLIINQKAMERIAARVSGAKAYALLKTRKGDSEEATAIIQRQPGVVMAD